MVRTFPMMVSGNIYYIKTFTNSEFIFESRGILGQRTAHTYSVEINIGCIDEDNEIVDNEHNIDILRQATDEEEEDFFQVFPFLIVPKEEEDEEELEKKFVIINPLI